MDASPESSIISDFWGLSWALQDEWVPPSFEGPTVQIVAAGPDLENGLLTYIRVLGGVFNLRPWMSFEMPRGL
jgi:hypothetical protein